MAGFTDGYYGDFITTKFIEGTSIKYLWVPYGSSVYMKAKPDNFYSIDHWEFCSEREHSCSQRDFISLTGNNAYPLEHGLELESRKIVATTYTKEGWYLKNGGLSDLNADIRDRLFNISTSQIVDDENKREKDGYKEGDYVRYYKDGQGNYKAFLTDKDGADVNKLVVLDDGTNCHIIEVEEAVSNSKLETIDNESSYYRLKATSNPIEAIIKTNDIVYNVVREVAAGDTYKKNAEQYYLVMSNIIFYDEDVYNYFKSQYPDLFK